jgi:hypothetical protein
MPSVQCEYGFDTLTIRQMQQSGIGQLNLQISILSDDRCDPRQISFLEASQTKWSRGQRSEQRSYGQWMSS